jgi:hypothetical protein
VQFYVNGANVGSAGVSGNVATYILTLPALNNTAYAMYLGDTNCPAAIAQPIVLDVQPAVTVGTLLVNPQAALQGASVTLTALFTAQATVYNPNPGGPSGSVVFYTTVNGIERELGAANLVSNGPGSSVATFATTGLQDGANVITAQFAGSTSFAPSTGTATVNVDDFTLAFSPPSATTTAGQTVTALLTVAPVDGFAGEVALNCAPPANAAATCTISPSVLTNGGGIATMTITTTAATGALERRGVAGGVSFAVGLLALLWPSERKRRGVGAVAAVAVMSLALLTLAGCAQTTLGTVTPTGGSGGGSGTTPAGTLLFTVTASGTDGVTTNTHTGQFQLTVQ